MGPRSRLMCYRNKSYFVVVDLFYFYNRASRTGEYTCKYKMLSLQVSLDAHVYNDVAVLSLWQSDMPHHYTKLYVFYDSAFGYFALLSFQFSSIQDRTIWAATCQNQQNECAPSEDRSAWASAQSDQSLRCPHEESLGPYLHIERTVKTLIRLGGCPGWSEYSLGAHSFCWFCHVAAHIVISFAFLNVNPIILTNILEDFKNATLIFICIFLKMMQ